ncbi:MAG: SIMPL domain-containing protein [Clostridiales bacterium]|nr:SIMPL domain-containing protein [Clostridiales bacterium]
MPRTITVKGMGRVTTAPDYVVISMSLEAHEQEYEATMELAAKKIDQLNTSLEEIGFEKKSVKTTNFNVRTDYERAKDRNGNYKSVFNGYICSHRLKVEFDFDTKRLAQTLYAISRCLAQPELSISFTVKDPSAVNKELLRSATVNAKEKAQILCEASGVELGQLLTIDYNWGELSIVSHTDYMLEEKCMAMPVGGLADMNIEPDDIDVSDTATFVWEIK